MTANSTPHPVADIALSPVGSEVGAFFDLDGTLVAGFTPTAHARDRMRRRQASVGEVLGVLEATFRYKLGRMEFERLRCGPPDTCAATRWRNSKRWVNESSTSTTPQ